MQKEESVQGSDPHKKVKVEQKNPQN